MKAISMWQPWGSLWLTSSKVHETRHWPTSHRGWLIVHAAKRFERDFDEPMSDILDSEFGNHWGQDLPTGAILGAVELISCLKMELTSPEHIDDMRCGHWSDERYAWRRGQYVVLPSPIPYRGRQGLFTVPEADAEPVRALIRLCTGASTDSAEVDAVSHDADSLMHHHPSPPDSAS